jgi:hypothetical protein
MIFLIMAWDWQLGARRRGTLNQRDHPVNETGRNRTKPDEIGRKAVSGSTNPVCGLLRPMAVRAMAASGCILAMPIELRKHPLDEWRLHFGDQRRAPYAAAQISAGAAAYDANIRRIAWVMPKPRALQSLHARKHHGRKTPTHTNPCCLMPA